MQGAHSPRGVGEHSFAAVLAAEARRFSMVGSEIRDSINRILRWIAWGLAPVMLLVINGQMQNVGGWAAALESGAWRSAIVGAAGAAIAMVPLGLVLLSSVAFAVGMVRLSRQQVLVQELAAVEGLARVDMLCFDKTGTLTDGAIEFEAAEPMAGAGDGWRDVLGCFASDEGANTTARSLAARFPDAGCVPAGSIAFSSERKWSAQLFADADVPAASAGTWVLGAPEIVLREAAAPGSAPVLERCADHARAGLRVLVLARAPGIALAIDQDEPELPDGLRPVVILTLRERIRPDAAETVAYFRAEGVDLRIMSGDDPRTVAAVARRVGIPVDEGVDVRGLPVDGEALAAVLERETVFGRVTPQQKRDMVNALRSAGHVVAMTGDGVNDILALKAADIGIAMNTGAPATRAVARLVLLDGRFSHLPGVVAEGRRVIANVERVSKLFLTKTAYSFLIAIGFGALLWGFPFLPRQLSVLDGLTLGIPGFFLAFLPSTKRYVSGFLGRALRFAIPCGVVVAASVVMINVAGRVLGTGEDERRAASSLVLALIALSILAVLMRPLRPARVALLAAMYAGLVLIVAIPLSREFLHLELPGQALLSWTFATALVGSVAIAAVSRWVRRGDAPADAG